ISGNNASRSVIDVYISNPMPGSTVSGITIITAKFKTLTLMDFSITQLIFVINDHEIPITQFSRNKTLDVVYFRWDAALLPQERYLVSLKAEILEYGKLNPYWITSPITIFLKEYSWSWNYELLQELEQRVPEFQSDNFMIIITAILIVIPTNAIRQRKENKSCLGRFIKGEE
ncbi:MAG: hypothetical protein ACFFCQ_14415, partial [Promethearchaeota archaeon]